MAALPERVREVILREVDEMKRRGDDPSAIAIEASTGEPPVLDALRATSGAIIGSSIAPNPARGMTTLHFELSEHRSLTFALHTINGAPLRRIAEATADPGKHSVVLTVDGLQPGIYLAVIRTTKGESAVQRVIVVE